jgi:hypothetical protein
MVETSGLEPANPLLAKQDRPDPVIREFPQSACEGV